jgi:hypothetical protein
MSRFGPRVEARSPISERMQTENLSGPFGSPCLSPCAEVMVCGEQSTMLEVQLYAHLQPGRGKGRTEGVPWLCPASRLC